MKTVLPIAAAITLIGSGVFAAIPSSGGNIKGCYDAQGNLRVIDEAAQCSLGETLLQWGTGAQGPAGPAGPAGSGAVSVTALVDYSPPPAKYTYAGWYDWGLKTVLVTLPVGKYAVTGRARLYHVQPGYVACDLSVGAQVIDEFYKETLQTLVEDRRTFVGVVESTNARGGSTVQLECQASGQFTMSDISLNFTKVDQLTIAPHL